ncbi:MAG: M20/M25/M40 family metallo-hydrolase [Candidatus Acidiferrum sp.]
MIFFSVRNIFVVLTALALWAPLYAQIPEVKNDPLHPVKLVQGEGACSAAGPSSCAQAASKITPVVMGESPLEGNLQRLTDEIGGRVSGSPEYARAVQWGIAGFRAAGVEVHTEKFSLPVAWSEGNSRLELSGPETFRVSLVSVGLSPATSDAGIEAMLVNVGYGTESEFAKAGAGVKGAILVVNSDLGTTWTDLFNEYLRPPAIIDRAVKGGALGILWTGERERKLLYRHTNASDGTLEKIPQAVLAREDGLRLQRTIDAFPGKMHARLVLPNKISGPVEQENVVGEIRGYEKPDEIVVLGAHLDSWELGTGALDNGCNAAMVVEAARAIKASGLLPRRTIRFILFGGEEQGMIGSWGYVRAHRSELDKYKGVVVFDSGVGRVTGYSLGGRGDIEPAINEILKPFAGWGVDHHTLDMEWGTDHFDFMLEGVPTLVANQDISNYLFNYHAASDTFDKVDIRELKLNTVLAAVTVWGIADRPEPIGARLSRSEIEKIIKQAGLEEQLRIQGYSEGWQTGTRGRQP